MIIDFHTHTFPDKISANVVRSLAMKSCTMPFTNGSMSDLRASMEKAKIDYSVNLPVMTSPDQVEKINHRFVDSAPDLKEQGIIAFGGMHPDYEHVKEELKYLSENGIAGIKIHPAYQGVDLNDMRFLRIIDIASEYGLIVLTHAGIDIGVFDHNYASTKHVLQILKEVQPKGFVLAHMGGWADWNAVESDLAGANLYFDTAFSYGPIVPYPEASEVAKENPYCTTTLPDEQFVRLCKKHGADKILFATDSPWQGQAEYVKRFCSMDFSKEEQQQILGENAAGLLGLY